MSDKKQCFVIAPIGEAGSDTRKRSDLVLKYVISPAVEELGYKAIRADQISEPGIITSQVIQHIVEDALVVADLTDRNPNVFYELAIRHALRKPLVQLIKRGETIPFDVAGTRTIHVDHKDLESVEEAKREIKAQVKALEKGSGEIETPISVSLDLQMLKQSDNPEDRSLADILAAVAELRTSVGSIEKQIGSPERLLPPDYLEYVLRYQDRSINLNRSGLPSRVLRNSPSSLFYEINDYIDRIMLSLKEIRSVTQSNKIEKELDLISEMTNRIKKMLYIISESDSP